MSSHSNRYSVSQLADLAGVTVRTLHHYDEIGLLPAPRDAAGHRVYGRPELERLQEVLFYAALDLPLADIAELLIRSRHDRLTALRHHRRLLEKRQETLDQALRTVNRSIQQEEGEGPMLTDDELYEGLRPEEIEEQKARQREARERWPDEYATADDRIRGMSRDGWAGVKEEGEAVARAMASLVDRKPTDGKVQDQVRRHHAWLENFYPVDRARYEAMADLYVQDKRFAAYYDAFAPGLASLLSRAMKHFARTRL